jgi:hypothetical protein
LAFPGDVFKRFFVRMNRFRVRRSSLAEADGEAGKPPLEPIKLPK